MNYFLKKHLNSFYKLSKKPTTTIFDKIITKQIPSTIIYETDQILAFKDINPTAPIHILIIPKHKANLTGIANAREHHIPLLGKLLLASAEIAKQLKISESGYRLVINQGQSVDHLHIHLIGGKQLGWPPNGPETKNKL